MKTCRNDYLTENVTDNRVLGIATAYSASSSKHQNPGFDFQIHNMCYMHDHTVRFVTWSVLNDLS